ncbi:MAG: CDP-diacylglycerol--glycerol-3-phosphate 3-phosphatidyltransferase [Synergistetes bacterium]|nr:CDP-diacylglycerol--glycerol-3-phosphate 3-phosphatidyltransferase [Synergistota bacterium]
MLLAIPFMASCLLEKSELKVISILIFAIASLTDYLDGRIARAYGIVTDAGKILDPIADKILITSAFVSFVQIDKIPAWIAVVIIAREFLVTGLRIIAAKRSLVIAASPFGKAKMVLQTITVFIILGGLGEAIDLLFIWATAIITILSGADYFIKNRAILKEALKEGG